VLLAAVALADERGLDALTMRALGQELEVEAMSLYNHVSNKEDVLDGIIGVIGGELVAAAAEVPPPAEPTEWKPVMRRRILAAREVMLRHRWAPAVFETRATTPPVLIGYYDEMLGLMREGGFSLDLAHHAMHAIGSRMLGFTQELFVDDDGNEDPDVMALMIQQMASQFPHLAELMRIVAHDPDSTVQGCDDQFEFEFGLDLTLDGLERLRQQAWELPAAS
jgi:AcrR family transcriptional regulator